jgi:hypothetical protein
VATFQIALILVRAGIFSRIGMFSMQSSLISSSFFLQTGVVPMLSTSAGSYAETSQLPPFLYKYGQFSSVVYFKALPIFATFEHSRGFSE